MTHFMKITFLALLAMQITFSAMAQEAEDVVSEDDSGETQAESSSEDGPSAEEVAKQLSNPNTALAMLNFNFDYVDYDGFLPGAKDAGAFRLSFQPSFPYPLGDGKNFFLRPLIPLMYDQPVPVVGDQSIGPQSPFITGSGLELGDISFDAAIGKSFSNGMILVGGVVATLPTATSDKVGLDQYLFGPEVLVAKVASWGALGLLLTHQWDVAGEDSFDTSVTGGQYFYTINLKNAWQIQGSPAFSYNHEAEDGQEWTLPFAIGLTKTTILNGKPWKFGVQYWHYLKQPDALGPDFQIRFTVTPVVPLPW